MRETTKNKKTGINWTLSEMLEDLDFADDIALLSHSKYIAFENPDFAMVADLR
jgi:hypothetical protein